MKALISHAAGGPETLVLEDRPSLTPKPGEVVIAVKAASVNFPDVLIVQDLYQLKPQRPFSPGSECAGVVKAIGDGVTHVAVGDRVIAGTGFGALAEEVVAAARSVHKMPETMSFQDGSALLMTYGTSYHALKDRAQLRAGETLLVLGAAGGVGVAAVELGKAMGAKVLAAVSSEEKLAFAKSCGADGGVVYPAQLDLDDKAAMRALGDAFKEAGGGGVDVVYDAVGGAYAEPALRALNWEGRYLVVGFPAGIPRIPLNLTLLKGTQIVGVFWGAFAARDPKANAAEVQELFAMHAQGKITPRIAATYPLARGAEAIQQLADRKVQGKIVVTME